MVRHQQRDQPAAACGRTVALLSQPVRWDTVVDTNFLEVVNNTYASGSNAIQTHRIYQERPNNVSILNAITDEINNSILRAGHVNLGLSASLNGSGTAIDFTWFKENIRHLKDDDDEKVIESLLLRERIYVEYLNNMI